MRAILEVILIVLDLYVWLLIASAIADVLLFIAGPSDSTTAGDYSVTKRKQHKLKKLRCEVKKPTPYCPGQRRSGRLSWHAFSCFADSRKSGLNDVQ